MGWGNIYLNDFLFSSHLSTPFLVISLGLAAASSLGEFPPKVDTAELAEAEKSIKTSPGHSSPSTLLPFVKNPLLSDSSFFIILAQFPS